MYINTVSEYPQHSFIQKYPKYHCPTLIYRQAVQERRGLEYLPKCRNPRCTHDCHANWSSKIAAIRARRLHDLQGQFNGIRGNLTLHKDAGPDEHRRVKENFLQLLRRWKKRHGATLELHGIVHATDPLNAHYDFVGYHDLPRKRACSIVRELWVKAGGKRASCVSLHDEEIDPVSSYQTHRVGRMAPINDTKHTVTPSPVFLLNSRDEIGLEMTWHTAHFWGATSADKLWQTLVSEWFPDTAADDLELAVLAAQRRSERAAKGLPPVQYFKPEPDQPRPIYHPGYNLAQDAKMIAGKLPSNPDAAVPVWAITKQWGLDRQPPLLTIPASLDEHYITSLPRWGEEYVRHVLSEVSGVQVNRHAPHVAFRE